VLQALCAIAAATSLSVLAGETTNKIGITMVDIPAGSFLMGSCLQDKKAAFLGESSCANPDPDALPYETPQHRVNVKAFQMGQTEVTLGQFKAFIKATGRSDLVDADFIEYNSNGDNVPVLQVSWNDAQDFISWLNKANGGGYRLPSEAEWEYACRSGSNSTYCGGDNLGAVAWYRDNSGNQTHAVGTKQANAFGLRDMSGNVCEWVEDYWHDSYSGAPTDGSAWLSGGEQKSRVLRGGSWFMNAKDYHAASRDFNSPVTRNILTGFRLARTR
jgi:formylglycine-generating enzyme required for sulfatase activity